jgi:nucleoside-triphosphatase THEP1
MFDSQSDVAAVVYAARDEPDLLLQAFANDLRRRGFRPAGLIQLGHRPPWDDRSVRLVSLPGEETMSLRHDVGTPTVGCRPDLDQLSAARRAVAAAIARGADLVIVNRFGRMEAEGGGFADEIRAALAADLPVLITVPEPRFTAWTRFSQGMGVKLECARGPLEAWWRSVSGAPFNRFAPAARTFCEIAK